MKMPFNLLLIFLTSFVLGLSLYPVFIRLYSKNNIVDKRDIRKIHLVEVPTMGGVPIFLAFLVATFIWISSAELLEQRYLLGMLIFIFFLGLRDDFISLRPIVKLVSQIVPGVAIFYLSDIRLTSLYGLIETAPFSLYISLPLTIFTIIVITNSFNLIDGLDGLAGTIGLIILFAFGTWFTLTEHPSYGLLMFAMAGSILAFLRFNWQPAKIFMGDTGALFLGFFFSVITINFLNINFALEDGSLLKFEGGIATAIAVLIIPLFDTLRIFTIRVIRKKSPFAADKNHTHHVLLRLGFTHWQTTIILGVVNMIFIGLAVIFSNVGDIILIPSLLFVGLNLSLVLDYLIIKQVVSKKGKKPHSLLEIIKSSRKAS
jgi:UDP-N-acetylmuramyl pentapeptide phosphotransferase/UDP-N-acetylglucosamine-1-phosphate transferase